MQLNGLAVVGLIAGAIVMVRARVEQARWRALAESVGGAPPTTVAVVGGDASARAVARVFVGLAKRVRSCARRACWIALGTQARGHLLTHTTRRFTEEARRAYAHVPGAELIVAAGSTARAIGSRREPFVAHAQVEIEVLIRAARFVVEQPAVAAERECRENREEMPV